MKHSRPRLILLFNHSLTQSHEADACGSLGIEKNIAPPDELQRGWSNVPPEIEGVKDWLASLFSWLAINSRPGDYILIQGEFGAVYLAVGEALRLGLRPIYSTTRREAHEECLEDGSVRLVHRFRHVRFREYGK